MSTPSNRSTKTAVQAGTQTPAPKPPVDPQLQARLPAAFVESSNDAILTKDLRGIITRWNKGAERLFGRAASEMLGSSILQIIPAELHPAERSILPEIKAGKRPDHYDTLRITKDGQPLNISLTASPIKGAGGRIVGVSKTARNITPRKKAQRDLGSFSYAMTHSLRGPFRAMDAFGQPMLPDHSANPPPMANTSLRIRSRAQRMDQLITKPRKLAGLATIAPHPTPVDPTSLAAEPSCPLQPAQPQRRVSWSVEPGLNARADPGLRREMSGRLRENARKNTARPSNPKIEFGRTSQSQGPAFFIRENGDGFDLACAKELFSPIQELQPAADFSGPGKGLAIVKLIVHRHGGTVWAETLPGHGAAIYFTLS